jgi:hypothetical protein
MLWATVFILVVAAIAVPVGIHLSNNNKKSVPTNTPEPGGTGPPVPPKVTPSVPPQSGQPPPVPPIVPPPVPKKYTYERQAPDNDQVWGCQLPNGKFASVSATELGGMGRGLLETECSERVECVGYYDGGTWLVSTNTEPKDCLTKSSEKYPIFYLRKETEG